MKAPIALGPGVMPDICAVPSGWIVAFRVLGGPLRVLALDHAGKIVAQANIDIGSAEGSIFPRLCVFNNQPYLAYPAWRHGAWWAVVRTVSIPLSLGPEILAEGAKDTFGNCPVCLSNDGWFAWQDADTLSVEGFRLDMTPIGHTLRDATRPTGLATCTNGVIVFVDEVRTTVPGMANPVVAGDCTVGENLTGGVRVLMADGRQKVMLSGDTFVPRNADAGGGDYAFVTWGAVTVTLQAFNQSDLNQVHEPPKQNHSKGSIMEINGKTIQLRGAGGRIIAPDGPGTGIWAVIDGKPSQWRGVLYVSEGATAARYKAKKLSDGTYKFTNIDNDCIAGGDGGQYSAGLDKQGYHKPTGQTSDDDAGSLERFHVYEGNDNGAIQAQIEQVTDAQHPAGPGKHIFAFPLTVEVIE